MKRSKWHLPLQAALAGGWLCAVSSASGALFIEVGDIVALPDQGAQSFSLYVRNTGSEPVAVYGLALNLQIADSGPPSRGGLGSIEGPAISGLNIIDGTRFELNNTGQMNGAGGLQFANASTTVPSDPIIFAAGEQALLAKFVIDTTGFSDPAAWELRIADTQNGPSSFFSAVGDYIIPEMIDGLLTVVPEPGAYAACFAALAAASAACLRSWRWRGR
jgi:hypothetical protein